MILERRTVSASQLISADAIVVGVKASAAGTSIKNARPVTKVRLIYKFGKRLPSFLDLNDEFNNTKSLDLTEGAKKMSGNR